MIEFYTFVAKAEKIRCRAEEAETYLLYNPRTDQLHLLDTRGKQIFDLCDGRSIDDVVHEGSALLEGAARPLASQQILEFLCELKKRELVVMC